MKRTIIFIILTASILTGSINNLFAQSSEQLYQKGLMKEEGEGALQEAIELYNQVADNSSAGISLRAKALLHVGMCYEKLGKQEATKAYQRLVNNFPTQKNEVAIARERLSRLILMTENVPEVPLKPNFTKIKMPGNPGNGMLSPDGKKIAFISEGDVWVVPVSGGVNPYITGEPNRLTRNIGAWDNMINSFCWSGNGKWIAFNAELGKTTSSSSIYVIPSEGGDAQKVQVPSHYCGWPSEFRLSLSPDGKTLAYASGWLDYNTRTTRIYTIPVNGNEAKELTEPGTWDPAWSPDGSRIAFVKFTRDNERNEYSELLVIPAQGGVPKKLIDRQLGQIRGPIWSPDGKMITYIKRPAMENPKEIWLVQLTDEGDPVGKPCKIDLPLASYHTIAGWTPEHKIGIQLTNPEYEIIYSVPVAGGIATQVTPQGWTSYPKWSPDGKRIYFRWDGGKIASVPSGGGTVDSISIDSEFNVYTALPGSGNEISPDGKTIVFSGAKNFFKDGKKQIEVDIFTVPVEGGKPKQLTEISFEFQDRFPCWSPDGNSIAFIRPEIIDKKFFMHIYTISRDGENLRRITDKSDSVAWAPIDWTQDGKSITYFSKDNEIRSIPAGGGESKFIADIDSTNSQFDLAWSPDGKELAYTDKGKIWIFTPQSGITKEVKTGVTAHATKIGWSPDGKKVAFTAFSGGDAELWMMENFLSPEKLEQKPENKDLSIRKALGNTDIDPLGSPSPDGRYISFIDWISGGNVGILNLDTKERRLITDFKDPNEQAYYSSWSPDGKQIAYFWWRSDKDQYNLSIVDVEKAESRVLFVSDKNNWIELGNWSSDGDYIFATLSLTNEPKSQIVRVSAADGTIKVLKTCEESYTGGKPYVSPDNRYVAYDLPDKNASGNSDIYLLSLENGQENTLIKHPSHDNILGWTPDGKNILFASDRSGTVDAMTISVENGKSAGNPKTVKQNIGQIVPLGFTQDGSFYYGLWPKTDNIYSAEINFDEGKILSKPTLLIQRFEGRNYSPDYSSDGNYLAYISGRGVMNKGVSGLVLCIRNLETGYETEIIPDPEISGRISDPEWSPDDRFIALTCYNKDGYSRIYSYDTQTKELTPLVTESAGQPSNIEYAYPVWSKDGKSLFYLEISRYSTTSRILVRNISTGADRELYNYSSDNYMDRHFNISLSPDGKWLASLNRGENRVLKIFSTEGGDSHDLYNFKLPGGWPLTQVWSRDGKYIVFPINEEVGGWSLIRVAFEGGKIQKITMNLIGINSLSLHPDGRTLAFRSAGYSLPENNIWEMKNFLPSENNTQKNVLSKKE